MLSFCFHDKPIHGQTSLQLIYERLGEECEFSQHVMPSMLALRVGNWRTFATWHALFRLHILSGYQPVHPVCNGSVCRHSKYEGPRSFLETL